MSRPPASPRPVLPRPAAAGLAVLALGLMVVVVPSVLGANRDEPAGARPPTSDHGPIEEPDAEPAGPDPATPRSWLRSVSTAPLRPRLAAEDAGDPPGDLRPHNPRIRVDDPAPDAAARADELPGVAVTAELAVTEVPVRHNGARERLRVALVDPDEFRVVTPGVTAEAEVLWQALEGGAIALTHEAAAELGVRPGASVTLGRLLRRRDTEVAGTVSLGRAAVADAVMHRDAADGVGGEAEPLVLVGVTDLDLLDDVIERLQEAGVGGAAALADIEPYHAELVGDDAGTADAFEPFTFEPADGGRIRIDPDWVDEHIVAVDLPVLGSSRCHRLIVPQLEAALEELVARELDDLLDPDDYGGCWVPRHIGWDDGRALSLHAWGIAFDVNVATNPYGAEPELDPRVVEVFERHGFNWGGRWRVPDGMHFELGELLAPDAVPDGPADGVEAAQPRG